MKHESLPSTPGTLAGEQPSDILDVSDGVDRVMGDRDLYARMLRRFRKDYLGGDGPIRAALAAADSSVAHRIAHTLKGAAGMIGARRLHRHAAALETSLRTGAGAEMACLDELSAALADVLRVIDGMLDDTPSAPPRAFSSCTPIGDPALLTQLLDLLADGDGAAIDLLEEFEASLRAILGDARFGEVEAAANEFDYERALAILRRQVGGL
ncbi:MAG: Hpt domain-containing protein [Telluria sp.]